MARDHRKLRVFDLSHRLVLSIYNETKNFPRDEWFGLRAQLRRAAVSVACNLVEGSARRTTADYVNFVNIARSSASELEYLVSLAGELGLLAEPACGSLKTSCDDLIPQLESLIQSLANPLKPEPPKA